MKNSIWHKKGTLQVTFHRQGQRQSHSPSHTFTFASRSRFRHKTNNHLILCLKILMSAFSQLKRHIDMCYVYMKVLAFNFLWKSQYSNHQSLQSLHTIFTREETGNTDATEKIKTQTLRWIVFCVNLTGVRDAQRAGETLFPGVSVRVFLERWALDGIQYLSVDWIRKSILTTQVGVIQSVEGLNRRKRGTVNLLSAYTRISALRHQQSSLSGFWTLMGT